MRARCDDKEGGEMCVKAPLTVCLCRVLHHYRRRQGKLVRVCNVQSLRLRSCPISHPSLVLFLSRLIVLSAIDLLQYSFSIRRQLSLVRTAWAGHLIIFVPSACSGWREHAGQLSYPQMAARGRIFPSQFRPRSWRRLSRPRRSTGGQQGGLQYE